MLSLGGYIYQDSRVFIFCVSAKTLIVPMTYEAQIVCITITIKKIGNELCYCIIIIFYYCHETERCSG